METLEPNMYVRTKKGMIAKIVSKENVSGSLHKEEIVFILDNGNRLALHSQKVVKVSHNIIDLIEVGDYVNGYKVEYKFEYSLRFQSGQDYWYMRNDDIKTIVTKEQFESMEYKVK